MPSPQSPIGEDQIYNLGTSGAIPSWMKDKPLSTQLVYLTRDIAKFSQVMHTRFPKPKTVKDRKFEYGEVKELERFYTCTVSSETAGTTYHTRFGLSNNEALQVQPNDILFLMGIYVQTVYQEMVAGQVKPAASGTQGTNVGPDLNWPVGATPSSVIFSKTRGKVGGYYFSDYEAVQVTKVHDKDSAGAGNTYIDVERVIQAPHAMDRGGVMVSRALVYSANGIGGDEADATIDAGMRILRGTPAFLEGTGAPDGLYKNPTLDNNFVQEWKYAVSYTLESQINNKILDETPMSIHKWMINKRTMRDKEFAFLFNRKAHYVLPDGRMWYTTGGLIEFIKKDAEHYLVYPGAGLSWPGFLDGGKDIFGLGGSAHRYMFCGYTLDAELRKMFYNDNHMRFEPELSKEFNIEVNSLHVSGGKISIIPNQVLEECGFSKIGILLDMDYSNTFVPVTISGWDYRNEGNVAEKGTNMTKELIQGMFGMERRYRDYHCIWDFSGAI